MDYITMSFQSIVVSLYCIRKHFSDFLLVKSGKINSVPL